MTPGALTFRCTVAAWLLTPVAWVLLLVGSVALVSAGPFALLLLPVALPPLVLGFVQARSGSRVLRGRAASSLPLFISACCGAAALLLGAFVGLPGPVTDVPDLADASRDGLTGVGALTLAAVVQAVAAVLLWPTARRHVRIAPARLVVLALCALAVGQVVGLTLVVPGQ